MINRKDRFSKKTLVVAIASTVLSVGLSAQGYSGRAIEEVVVTAQKRPQTLQDVPLAVSAFSEETMKSLHFGDANDIFLYTPGLVSAPDFPTAERSAIRGLGSEQFGYGFVNHVGVFVDGVYQEGAGEMYDVERVEVIKGPVGALFGRSSIAGAISITRNKPADEYDGSLDISLGELGRQSYTGVVNVPLTDNLFFRAAGKYEENDGYLNNIVTGEDLGSTQVEAMRMAFRFIGDNVDATLTASYEERADIPNIAQVTSSISDESYNIGTPFEDSVVNFILDPTANLAYAGPFEEGYDVASSLKPKFTTRFHDLVADIEIDLSEDLTLKSLTNYRNHSSDYLEDFDGNAIADLSFFGPYGQDVVSDHVQQELHFSYTTENDWLFLFGSSYYKTDLEALTYNGISDTLGNFNGFASGTIQREQLTTTGDFSGWSTFADLTISLTDRLDLTLGARYTYDEKELTVFIQDPNTIAGNQTGGFGALTLGFIGYTSVPIKTKDDWSDITGRLALNFTMTDDVSFYMAYSQGSKSGGIDAFSFTTDDGFVPFFNDDLSAVNGAPKSVDPESSDSYELGMKSYWLDRRVQFNSSAFFYEFKDQQQLVAQGAALIVENVGLVAGSGIEADVRFLPTENLDVSLSAAYLDTEVKENDRNPSAVGSRTGRAPAWTGSVIATYTHPLPSGASLYSTFSHSYQGKMVTDAGGPNLPPISISNIRLGYEPSEGRWGASLYVDNVFDEFVFYDQKSADGVGYLQDLRRQIGRPRTAGIDISYNF